MTRPRDYAYEALAEVTGSDMTAARGELNAALKSVREQSQIEDSYLLADEIHVRAKLYRQVMPDVMLTPSALAKHWLRVFEETEQRRSRGTNQHAGLGCETCSGDKFVQVESGPDRYAVCPDCSTADASFWRHDGTRFVPPDSARVREMMNR